MNIKKQLNLTLYSEKLTLVSLADIKRLGLVKTQSNLDSLINMFYKEENIDKKREIVSSIGRQKNLDKIYSFLEKEYFESHYMDIIYQMYRTCLYKGDIDNKFFILGEKFLAKYNNEIMLKMKIFYINKKTKKKTSSHAKTTKVISQPLLLIGDNITSLKKLQKESINLIFTSPPYYNAKEYSVYTSYKVYLHKMYQTLLECYNILETGRFIIINVSPVITKRPGREFESIRYPIHFDFHQILLQAGFYFIDEIIWIKPEYTVPNRNGGYVQTKRPLMYKPNCITESLLVYRKNANFLLDKNINKYPKHLINDNEVDSTNCWYIPPKNSNKHPAVFPEELCKKVLKYYSFPKDVVLDPFAGSGTLGKVAYSMDRIPVMCEINKKYIKEILRGNIKYEQIF